MKTHKPLSILLTGYFYLAFSTSLFAQMASVPCICELEAMLLDSKIEKSKITLVSFPQSKKLEWKYEEKQQQEIPPIQPIEEISDQNIIEDTKVRSAFSSSKLNRKKVRRKRKLVKKKKRSKKYKGQCPAWR